MSPEANSTQSRWQLEQGDCLAVMHALMPGSIDAIVTDPPYGLGFMGKAWDKLPPGEPWARECLRVLRPGGYLLAFGGTRTYHRLAAALEDGGFEIRDQLQWLYGSGFPKGKACLKPGHEPIVLARRPASRVAPLNIDDCRLDTASEGPGTTPPTPKNGGGRAMEGGEITRGSYDGGAGRWPANVLLDEEAAAILDMQSGVRASGAHPGRRAGIGSGRTFSGGKGAGTDGTREETGSGGASRFFYVGKASGSERDAGLNGRNQHPTVKPVSLMRWLVRLITPNDGVVLDPFTGSGTTGIAALLEDRRFVGIEREPEYVTLARARIAHWEPAPSLFTDARDRDAA